MDSVKDEPKGCCDSDGDHVYDSDSCERDAGKPESHCGAVGGCCAVSDDDKDDGKTSKAGCGQPDGCCGEPIDDDEVGNAAAVSISAATALTTTTISVVGMTCSDCANSAEKLLRKLPGVVSVDASFAASRVVVHHDALVVGTAEIVERLGKLKFTGTVTSSVVDGASDESAEAEVRRFVVLLSAASRKSDDYAGVVARMRVVRGVEGVDIDSANGRATVHIASNVKRRDVLDAFGAAQLPSALFDAHAAAAAISEASERRELRRWLAQVVLASAIAIPLALMTFAFPDRIAPVVRLSVGFVLCSIVQVVVGAPLYQSAFGALRYTREANVDCLVMLSTTVAYVYSTIVWIVWLAGGAVAGEEAETFFETPPILLALIVIGRYLEKGAKRRTGEALRSIRKLQTPTAQLLSRVEDVDNADAVRTLDCALLDVGDLVRVEPGAAVPVDGVVVRGTTTVDESMITGEARPLRKTVGATMLGGTSNIDGCVALRVTATAHRSTVARIAQLMSDAQVCRF
jgi:Cu+-exporting ATPase